MSGSSSTSPPLPPAWVGPTPGALGGVAEGAALNDFLQAWVAGISGLDGSLVRPAYQAEPPTPPPAGETWATFTVRERTTDNFPVVSPSIPDYVTVRAHETLQVLVSFYGLGSDGRADEHASLLREGMIVEANRYVLQLAGWGIVERGPLTAAPSLVRERWQYRVDLPVTLRREVVRAYATPDIDQADVAVLGNFGP